MFRSILVALKPTESSKSLMDFACDLASRRNLEVIGVSVLDANQLSPPEPVPLGATVFRLERDQERLAAARQAAVAACATFAEIGRAKSLDVVSCIREGDVAHVLASEAQAVDVLLLGHTSGGDASERSLLYSIVKHNARPAIIVPKTPFAGETVLLAYDGSVQAAKAMASFANSGLAGDRVVYAISVDRDLDQARSLACLAEKYLGRHGIAAQARGLLPSGALVEQIRYEAARVGACLIVMGAFGKRSVREFLFGSATRGILDSLETPVFVDH